MSQSDFNWFIAVLAFMVCCNVNLIGTFGMSLMGTYLVLVSLGNMLK